MEKKIFTVDSTNDEQILMNLCRKLKATTIKVVNKSSNSDQPSYNGLGLDARGWFKEYEIGAPASVIADIVFEYIG